MIQIDFSVKNLDWKQKPIVHCTVSVGDKLGTVRDTKNLYVYQMSLKRINCYHHSLWLSVNLLVAKKNYLLLSPYCFSIDFCSRNLRVKLETTLDSICPFQYDDVPQETLYSQQRAHAQHAERIFNTIAKAINKTFA